MRAVDRKGVSGGGGGRKGGRQAKRDDRDSDEEAGWLHLVLGLADWSGSVRERMRFSNARDVEARRRTHALVEPLSDEQIDRRQAVALR